MPPQSRGWRGRAAPVQLAPSALPRVATASLALLLGLLLAASSTLRVQGSASTPVQWSNVYASPSQALGAAIKTAGPYVGNAGSFVQSLALPGWPTVSAAGNRDGYFVLSNLDTGQILGVRTIGGPYDDVVETLVFDPSPNPQYVLIIGSFQGSATMVAGSTTVQMATSSSLDCRGPCFGMFIIRLKLPNLAVDWAVHTKSGNIDLAAALTVTPSSIWFTGLMNGAQVVFSNGGIYGGKMSSYGGYSVGQLLELSGNNGAVLWRAALTGFGTDTLVRCMAYLGQPIGVDAVLAVSGMFRGDAAGTLKPTAFGWEQTARSVTSRGGYDLFVAVMFKQLGTALMSWLVQIGGSDMEWQPSSASLAVRVTNGVPASVIVSAYTTSRDAVIYPPVGMATTGVTATAVKLTAGTTGSIAAFVAAFDVNNGKLQWLVQLDGPGDEIINGILTQSESDCVNCLDSVWAVGYFSGTYLSVPGPSGPIILQSDNPSKDTAFLLQIHAGTGTVVFASRMNGPGDVELTGIAASSKLLQLVFSTTAARISAFGTTIPGSTLGTSQTVVASVATDAGDPCVVSDWSGWAACSLACGSGTQIRSRTYLSPSYVSANCTVVTTQRQACNTAPCKQCSISTPYLLRSCGTPTTAGSLPCTFSCNSTLTLTGTSSASCDLLKGAWSTTLPTCTLQAPLIQFDGHFAAVTVTISAPQASWTVVRLDGKPPSCNAAYRNLTSFSFVSKTSMSVAVIGCRQQVASPVATSVAQVSSPAPIINLVGTYPMIAIVTLPPSALAGSALAATACQCFVPYAECDATAKQVSTLSAVLYRSSQMSAATCHAAQLESTRTLVAANMKLLTAAEIAAPDVAMTANMSVPASWVAASLSNLLKRDLALAMAMLVETGDFSTAAAQVDTSRLTDLSILFCSDSRCVVSLVVAPAPSTLRKVRRSATGSLALLQSIISAQDYDRDFVRAGGGFALFAPASVQLLAVSKVVVPCTTKTCTSQTSADNGAATNIDGQTGSEAAGRTPIEIIFFIVLVVLAVVSGALFAYRKARLWLHARAQANYVVPVPEPPTIVVHATVANAPEAVPVPSSRSPARRGRRPNAVLPLEQVVPKATKSPVTPIPVPVSARSSGSDGDEGRCVVCMESQIRIVLSPCMHVCLCATCAAHPTLQQCPLCRTPIEARVLLEDHHPPT